MSDSSDTFGTFELILVDFDGNSREPHSINRGHREQLVTAFRGPDAHHRIGLLRRVWARHEETTAAGQNERLSMCNR